LADALVTKGDRAEALRFLRHGATTAAQAEVINTALAGLQAGGPG
jgi:hypothetical protein